jgi:hypothetical protein
MTLGKQFENTYWHDDQGQIQSSVRTPTFKNAREPLITNDDATVKAANVGPLQGMLFSPHVGTGTAKDPSVSPDVRRAAIDKAVGFDQGINTYIGKVKQKFGKVIGERAARGHQDMVRDSFDRTDFPISELRETHASVLVNPQAGRSFAEEHTKDIKLNWDPGRTQNVRVETQVPSAGVPIHNPKFWDSYEKMKNKQRHGNSDEEGVLQEDVLQQSSHWLNPQTGHTIDASEHLEDVYAAAGAESDAKHADVLNSLRDKGYYPNLFSGKGGSNDGNRSTPVKLAYDYTSYDAYNRTNEMYRKDNWHLKHSPGEGTETVVSYEKKRTPPSTRSSTLIHELGHQRDANMGADQSYRHLLGQAADPVEEGLADAHADRYVYNRNQFDDVVNDHKTMANHFEGYGYTTSYSGWKDKAGKAVYNATRLHSQMSPTSYQDIPNRDELMNALSTPEERKTRFAPNPAEVHTALEKAQNRKGGSRASYRSIEKDLTLKKERTVSNNLFLGHMIENFPHIREHLDATGYSDVADKAHAEYTSRWKDVASQSNDPKVKAMYHAMRRQHPEWEAGDQPTLPGF